MAEDNKGFLKWMAEFLRETLGELLVECLWWAFWGALIIATIGGVAGFVIFGWTGLLWGVGGGLAAGAVLGVLANLTINTAF